VFPTGVKVLIDGGPPNGKALAALGRVLPPNDRSIDLVVMSHPQLDHFGGLIEIIERYRVGAFVSNGLAGTVSAYGDLERTLAARGVREITLSKGDMITNDNNTFSVLSPGEQIVKSKNINDAALVLELVSKNAKVLFTGDISAETEAQVSRGLDGNIDVLKVAHHGSKFSSSASFLAAARPKISVIEVGKNSYGHPTQDVLGRLGDIGSKIFRTDKNSTVEAVADGKRIQIFSLP
jgi:competence protein ComEC